MSSVDRSSITMSFEKYIGGEECIDSEKNPITTDNTLKESKILLFDLPAQITKRYYQLLMDVLIKNWEETPDKKSVVSISRLNAGIVGKIEVMDFYLTQLRRIKIHNDLENVVLLKRLGIVRNN